MNQYKISCCVRAHKKKRVREPREDSAEKRDVGGSRMGILFSRENASTEKPVRRVIYTFDKWYNNIRIHVCVCETVRSKVD